ncbi:hypothetical protein RISK_006048 [Rhodopirellula islandica]|uniref:Uncharacterized protein n=1 Tax=Rhodopirellula islandica TaxID=595434 RepID=A0A0J1E8R9_RHOIS|nr:hypothetical protein RISK_006048 [Rhodopirellula islandica]
MINSAESVVDDATKREPKDSLPHPFRELLRTRCLVHYGNGGGEGV